ncbi:MAG: peptide chain release factor N(5)-glutamine methyltransferase [Planctomycetota bacterium]
MDLLQRSATWLQGKGVGNARRETEWLFADALQLSRLELYTRFDMPLEPPEVERLRAVVARRGRREPLAYVLGNQDFRGLVLTVSPAVLVPRPETEELVDLVLRELPTGLVRVLDVGTGSGAIALALKHARPEWDVHATDASAEALEVARANAQRLGIAVGFTHGHLAQHCVGPFAAVVANLPYIAEDERGLCDPELAFEPTQALFPGGDGLSLIRELLADAPRLLTATGALWLEHGFRQGAAIRSSAQATGLSATSFMDSQGHERFTVVRHG